MADPEPIPSGADHGHSRPALVCFEHRPAKGALRLLRPGFRHCFCLLREPESWLLCDPLKGGMLLETLPDMPLDGLVEHFAGTGRHVAIGRVPRTPSALGARMRPLTCVEVVKRAVGVHAGRVLTPWQLYRRLIEAEGWQARPASDAKMLDET